MEEMVTWCYSCQWKFEINKDLSLWHIPPGQDAMILLCPHCDIENIVYWNYLVTKHISTKSVYKSKIPKFTDKKKTYTTCLH